MLAVVMHFSLNQGRAIRRREPPRRPEHVQLQRFWGNASFPHFFDQHECGMQLHACVRHCQGFSLVPEFCPEFQNFDLWKLRRFFSAILLPSFPLVKYTQDLLPRACISGHHGCTKTNDTCGIRTHAGRPHRLSRPTP